MTHPRISICQIDGNYYHVHYTVDSLRNYCNKCSLFKNNICTLNNNAKDFWQCNGSSFYFIEITKDEYDLRKKEEFLYYREMKRNAGLI